MKLGSLQIGGCVAPAPMAGIIGASFRQLCMDFGAGYVVTEVVSVQGLTYKNYKTNQLMKLSGTERPVVIQLFGDEPDYLARGVEIATNFSPSAIDINAGYPAPKVCGTDGRGHGSDSALMEDSEFCGKIVAAVKITADVPVTVEIRRGQDKNNISAVGVAQICEAVGVDAIAAHRRARGQMYQPSAGWEVIIMVKQTIKIPVIGNGGATDAKSAARMLKQTSCDMVTIGYAVLGSPWIFREIHACLTIGVLLPPPTLDEKLFVTLHHIRAMCEDKGENRAMHEARKYAGRYLKGLPNVASFRCEVGQLTVFHDIELLAQRIFSPAAGGASYETVMRQKPPATDFPVVEGFLL